MTCVALLAAEGGPLPLSSVAPCALRFLWFVENTHRQRVTGCGHYGRCLGLCVALLAAGGGHDRAMRASHTPDH
jgi:hypothetical protein